MNKNPKIKTEDRRLRTVDSLKQIRTHYCAGCGHGIVHKLVCEAIDCLQIREKVIAVAPVGCAVLAYDYWDFDVTEAAHGRAPAVATGIKRVLKDRCVFTYQGDGDLAAIGTAEIIHAAARGELISVIFVNNGVYGMTNGQMAPTTLIGQYTSTTQTGRDKVVHGYPLHITEMIADLPGVVYAQRLAIADIAGIRTSLGAIKKAFSAQLDGKGFSLVEILSPCPTYWKMSPVESMDYIKNAVIKEYPLGIFKDTV